MKLTDPCNPLNPINPLNPVNPNHPANPNSYFQRSLRDEENISYVYSSPSYDTDDNIEMIMLAILAIVTFFTVCFLFVIINL